MEDAVPDRPGLSRQDEALRYLCAAVPMLFFGAILVVIVARDAGRLPEALSDLALGVVGLVAMRWRRRWPWQIALFVAVLTVWSTTATGPAFVAYVSLCTHRRWRRILPVAAVSWLCLVARSSWYGVNQTTLVSVVTGTVVLAGLTILGLYLRGGRDLTASRRAAERAAERAQAQRVETAKVAERAQIAREMHDVLAHRLSLLAMLAGALAYRTDLDPAEARRTALSIHDNAHQSLTELRSVLGGLRADGGTEAPQPTLADLDALFDEVRGAGQRVTVTDAIVDRDRLPAQTGRHAYRIVQEALTNARKHAPGSRVDTELSGRPGTELRIRLSNTVSPGSVAGPGGRVGLIGLAERIRLAGGSLRHTVEAGRFALDARLPWED